MTSHSNAVLPKRLLGSARDKGPTIRVSTGWFVESPLTQTLIHVIRTNKIPFLQSRSSWPVAIMTLVIMAVGIAIPFSSVGRYLGFSALPGLHWPLIAATLLCYVLLTQGVKMWLLRRRWI